MVIMGLDHVDQFGDIVRHHEAGTIPPTVMWGACPTCSIRARRRPAATPRSCGRSCPIASTAIPTTGTACKRRAWPMPCCRLWQTARAQPRRRGDRLVHPLAARRRAQPAQHARGRPAGRRLCQRPGRLSPPVPRRRALTAPTCPGSISCGSSSHPGGNITGLSGLQRGAGDPRRSRHHGRLGADADRAPGWPRCETIARPPLRLRDDRVTPLRRPDGRPCGGRCRADRLRLRAPRRRSGRRK